MRLIDADALRESIYVACEEDHDKFAPNWILYDMIDNAPTITSCPNCGVKMDGDKYVSLL